MLKYTFYHTYLYRALCLLLALTLVMPAQARKKRSRKRVRTEAVQTNGPLAFPRASNANVGIAVIDLSSGDLIVNHNADNMLTPASITKCVTAAAIEMADLSDSRIPTEVYVRGEINNSGCLSGDIVIRGNGDPTVESGRFNGRGNLIETIAGQLRQLGVKEIYGGFEVDSMHLKEQGPPATWEVGDLPHAYGAGLYALNYRDNAIGDSALENPDEELLIALEEHLIADSVSIDWNDVLQSASAPRLLVTLYSPTLAEILRITLEKSHNLYAEALLRRLAPGGFRADALRKEVMLLKESGLDVEACSVADGSGLTRANSLSPRFMAELLEFCAEQPWGRRYLSYFPLVGMEGTVRKLLKGTPLEGRLAFKSGSMGGVQTYAGYKLDNNGTPTHAIAIMVNDFSATRASVVDAIEKFLLKQFAIQ